MAKKKAYFEPVDTKVDFPALEREILRNWYESGIVKKYLARNKRARKYFSFQDGPITANNPMGVHHGWGRTYKDLWQKFKNMQGYRERFQNGFDAQGLWVEVEVEKELGLKSKKDIENLVPGDKKKSIAKFVELCKRRVFKFADIQTEQSKRLGYFMDWDNSYFTLSDDNNYMIWHFLKKCHEKGLIYKGRDSVPWCPRCGTAISQHEMLTEDYKDATHESVYVAYPLIGTKSAYFLVWTTTPWTLPGNVAIAVNPKLTYALAEDTKTAKKYYLLASKAKKLKLNIIKKLKGQELVGLTYESPFDSLPRVKEALGSYKHTTVASDDRVLPVSEEEGTGMVHVATGAGSEDFALGKKLGLPVIELIDEEATYIKSLGALSGQNAKKNPEVILNYLKEFKDGEHLFRTENYTHRYPACWRCKTELVWRVVDEWYIALNPVRESMKEVTRKIKWIPEFGLRRELDWLDNMHDWLISKKRYWGLTLPIWVCKQCDHFEVIGGKEELQKRATKGWDKFSGNSPHRPFVDEVTITCERCGGESKRIPDVGNPWLDAGIVPYSTIKEKNKGRPLYTANKRLWERWFPVDFITESFPGQFKNWFYAMIAMSTVLENKEPFKTVLGFATLLGEDGRAMHKSWGNSIEFNEGADKIGVDVMRWMYTRQNPTENMLFGYKVADEVRRRFHLKVWNIYNFFVTYANLDEWEAGRQSKPRLGSLETLDKWILYRLSETIEKVTTHMEKYDAFTATGLIEEFVDDLSNWYVRRSRERLGPSARSDKSKNACYQTLYFTLRELSKLLAPFTPFMADSIYTNLTKEKSVHLADWPRREFKVNEKLIEDMTNLRSVVEDIHAQRKELGIPVRQPLGGLTTSAPFSVPLSIKNLLMDEVNIRKWNIKRGKEIKNTLDTEITPELAEEAKARELIRQIQEERRARGVELTDTVKVVTSWLPESESLKRKIMAKTLATELTKGKFKVTRTS